MSKYCFVMKKVSLLLLSILSILSLYAQSVTDSLRSVETWESGNFESYRWERPGSRYLWEITTEGTQHGRYCARSGNYYANGTESILQMAIVVTDSGRVSYQRRVFSENRYDFFRFYLDGVLMEELCGNVAWGEFSCPISIGYHQLKFVYHKDGSTHKGSDCAWIDDVSWPGTTCPMPITDTCTAPGGLVAALQDGSVTLTWDGDYRIHDTIISDDIESHTYGEINSSGSVGWSYIDGDGEETSTLSKYSFIGEGEMMAYVVLDDELMAGSPIVPAHSGHRYLASVYHSSTRNDDWIISPELHFADTFTFSFWARALSSSYANEKFIVAYSVNGDSATDFFPLHCDTLTTTDSWTLYSFTVPAAAQHVAIHHVSLNRYIFCLDDLCIRGRVEHGHTTNVYRNDGLIAQGVTTNTYCDTMPEVGHNHYYVTYNCSPGIESASSDTVVIVVGDTCMAKSTMDGELPFEATFPAKATLDSSHMAYTMTEMYEWNKYPSYDLYVQLLEHFQNEYPQLCRLDTILDSTPHATLHHAIYALHLSNTLDSVSTKPAFLYSSTMHGDEVVGYYLMLHLADYILSHAETDSLAQEILQNVDLYICPIENPDGTYYRSNDLIYGSGYSRRQNYRGYDLNRNYPYLPGTSGSATIQPETQAMMQWMESKNFVMSVNFHCGAETVNLPWDNWSSSLRTHADFDWYRYAGQNFATICQAQDSSFMHGTSGRAVVDGGDWYVCTGTRQDYMNYYQRCREVTIEICDTHLVLSTSSLPTYWTNSKDALLRYILESCNGFGGMVTDAITGEPIEAKIEIVNHDRFHSEVYSHLPLGAYHRPIMAGQYQVVVSAPCYVSDTFTVTTLPGMGMRHDVSLQPRAKQPHAASQYLLAGHQATLVAISDNTVLWYDSDTASQPLATGALFTTPELYTTTTYYLEEQYLDDTLLCISPRDSVTVYVIDTATQYITPLSDNSLRVYPNPTSRYCIIEATTTQPLSIELHDLDGRLVLQQTLNDTRQLDLHRLPAGLYFLSVSSEISPLGVVKLVVGD